MVQRLSVADVAQRTKLLVLQGTPFCNLDCRYCYLPDRDQRRFMSRETATRAVAWLYEQGLADRELTLIWHAGEPLVVRRNWYEETFDSIAAVKPPEALLFHSFQTNATLIDNSWCDFFLSRHIRVGVSLDGPEWLHDLHRHTRSGTGTHKAAMRGVRRLQEAGVPFHAICVVTSDALDAADEIADFFIDNGIERVGFNIEESEGVNAISTLQGLDLPGRYANFLDKILARAEATGRLSVREADRLIVQLGAPAKDEMFGNDENSAFAIVTVSHEGGISTFSPELAGLPHDKYGSFELGNVHTTTLDHILADTRFVRMQAEIAMGVAACADSCPYFSLCRGGAPSNKLTETGGFDATETMYCKLTKIAAAEVVLKRLESHMAGFGHKGSSWMKC